jgi:hypothetical protein
MAKGSSGELLDFPDLEQDPTDDLAFQDIRHSTSPTHAHKEDRKGLLSGAQASRGDQESISKGDQGGTGGDARGGYFSLSYYQQWFEIDTDLLVKRVLKSLLPALAPFYTESDPTPDLYGPFWITTTLIVDIAFASNLANYISSNTTSKWQSVSSTFKRIFIFSSSFFRTLRKSHLLLLCFTVG